MKEIIKHFQTLLTCEQFLLTGSKALSLMGLVEKNKVGDIDIILINPTEEAKSILERLQANSPAKTSPGSGGRVSYIFMHDGVKIDVFIEREVVNTALSADGVLLNPVNRIIQAKKTSSRMKDWQQLRSMARGIFKPEEFEAYLNNY